MRFWRMFLMAIMGCALLSLPAAAQHPNDGSFTFFGGALLGSPSGFGGGVGLGIPLTTNASFEPTVALGRSGHSNVFTLDGSFVYNFHLPDSGIVPYVLGGVGLAQWGGSTHGSPIIGIGARFPLGGDTWIRPEIRAADHGLSRFTIGITKTF